MPKHRAGGASRPRSDRDGFGSFLLGHTTPSKGGATKHWGCRGGGGLAGTIVWWICEGLELEARMCQTDAMFRLDGQVALVTGASRGIGKATALALAGQGARVFVNYRAGEEQARQVVEQIVAAGGAAQAVGFDVADAGRVGEEVASIAKQAGRLDIVVSNAGISRDGLLMRQKEEQIREMIETNLLGALAVAKAATGPMLRQRSGRIVFVASVVGEMGNAGQVGYAATKAALQGVMRSLAKELASRTITVNAVAPGLIETDMTASLDSTLRAQALTHIPLGRFGAPQDVANAIVFLCSKEANYITGQTLRVNGGMYV